MKTIHIILSGLFLTCSIALMQAPRAFAFGECTQYGIMAQYDSLSGTCKCMYGYHFVNGTFGTTCESWNDTCHKQLGIMSSYNSLYNTCECYPGYIIDTDLMGNKDCQSGNIVCHNELGIHSSYNSLSKKCTCDYGYTIVNNNCVSTDDQCRDQLGIHATYNSLDDTCQCDSGYIIDAGECKEADSVCRDEHGYNSSYNSSTKKCECDDDYTLDESGQCVDKQHNVYFTVEELNTDNDEAIIKSDDDGSYYHISYGLGCLSIWRYEGKQIVVNLGTDYSLDTWDEIVLQDDDETCNIVTKERVDSDFSLNEEEEASDYYVPDTSISFEEDIASSPYKQAIANLKQKGIVGGYPDGTYMPNNSINRAEFMKIIMGAVGLPVTGNNCYSDVKDEWFAGYACTAKQQGIATGYPDETFKPTNNINVAEALKISLKAFAISVRDPTGDEEWFTPYVEAANSHDLYLSTFDSPNKRITREEMAELVNRILDLQGPAPNTLTVGDCIKLYGKGSTLNIQTGQCGCNYAYTMQNGKCVRD